MESLGKKNKERERIYHTHKVSPNSFWNAKAVWNSHLFNDMK